MTRIAYLGPAGTFTEEAARRFELPEPQYEPVDSPAAALDAVRANEADFAVVAIENSVDGAVSSTSDALVEPGVQIVGETELAIAFAFMTQGMPLADARTLATHPVAYQQVKQWAAANMPQVRFVPASSNAAAARMVAEGEVDVAAAPERAAELFGLTVHARGVADMDTARTRFVLVAPEAAEGPKGTGNDRTSLVFTTPNKPGTLVAILQEFAARGVDMSRIESRPTRREPNTYNFFVDLVGHIEDPQVADAVRAVEANASWVRFLGSWPKC